MPNLAQLVTGPRSKQGIFVLGCACVSELGLCDSHPQNVNTDKLKPTSTQRCPYL